MGHELRITAKRRKEIDLDKLAAALLDYVETLSDAELDRLASVKAVTNKKRAAK